MPNHALRFGSVKPTSLDLSHKAVLDSLLLPISGVEAGEMSGLPAYFVNKRMFACIANGGVGVRLSAAAATELQFSKDNVTPFQPGGRPSTREWIQINHENSADYRDDLQIFQSSIDFVRGART